MNTEMSGLMLPRYPTNLDRRGFTMKDTTEDAAEVQRAVYRRLGGSGRVAGTY